MLVDLLEVEFKFLMGGTYICAYTFLYYIGAKLLSEIRLLNRTHSGTNDVDPEN